MKEQKTISAVLESQHRWIDERFQRFQQRLAEGQVNADLFEETAQVLQRHIYLEEEILFPEIEARGLVGPTTVMAQEHGEIWRFLEGIRDRIQQDAKAGRIQSTFDALRSLLEEHNFKEEGILYPSADRLLGRDAFDRVLERLREAEPPEAWECRARRVGGG